MPNFQQFTQAIPSGFPAGGDPPIKLKDGTMLTPEMFQTSAKNGMPFNSMNDMADYYNDWSRKPGAQQSFAPYYRTVGGQNINGGNVALLYAKYKDDPKVMTVLNRIFLMPRQPP